jgi:hypothetical protein
MEGNRILAQDKLTVRSGRFSAGPFTMGDLAYPAGMYVIDILSPVGYLQPQQVKAVIGQEGELLRGASVTWDPLGTTRVVHYQKQFEIR